MKLFDKKLGRDVNAGMIRLSAYLDEWEESFVGSDSPEAAQKKITDLRNTLTTDISYIVAISAISGLSYSGAEKFDDARQATFKDFLNSYSLESVRQPQLITEQMRTRLDELVISKFNKSEWTRSSEIRDILENQVMKFGIYSRDGAFIRETHFTPKTYAQMYARTRASQAHTDASIQAAISDGMNAMQISSHGTDCEICAQHEGQIYDLQEFIDNGDLQPPYHPNCEHVASPIFVEK